MQTIDNIFIKAIALGEAGMMYPQHSHEYAHSTLLARGRIVLWKNDIPAYYTAPAIIWIEANIEHRFQSLEPDCLLFCLHNMLGDHMRETLIKYGLELDDANIQQL